MSREKQIEEMAKATIKHCEIDNQCGSCHWSTCNECLAEVLYNAGYRKQSVGEWKHPPYAPFGGSYEMKRCSVCGYKPDFDTDIPYTKFCPNCGAKMKGESK